MPKPKKPIYRPEIELDARLAATHQSTKVIVRTMNDAVMVIEGVKETLADHFVILYLNKQNILVGLDAFLANIPYLKRENDISVHALDYQRNGKASKAILAQTFAKVDEPTAKQVKMQELSDIALRLAMFRIDVIDIIFIGKEKHFSFKKNYKAMQDLKDLLQKKKDVLGY